MRRRILLAALFGVLALLGFGASSAWSAASELRAARAELETAEARAKDLEVEPARNALEAADVHITRARDKIRVLPLRVAGLVPYLGRSIRAADNLTAAAGEVIAGAGAAIDAADLLPQQGRFTVRDGRLPKVDWSALEAASTRAAEAFARAEALTMNAPASGVLGVIADARTEILDGVTEARQTAERLADGARVLPDLLGERGARRHLVIIQNAAEVRATGGAIEAAMLLRADERDLDLISSDPDELAFGTPGDRDRSHRLNLDADFSVAARRIAATYRQVVGTRPDTVIALDVDALAAILRVAGRITVDGVNLDGDNLVPFLSRDIFERYPSEVAQGVFLGRTSNAMWDRLTQGRLPMRSLLEQLGAAARAKHIQLWSRDAAIQGTFAELDVAGLLPRAPEGGLVLGASANNTGRAELDWYARRTLRAAIAVAPDGTAETRLDVIVRNSAKLGQIPPAVRAKQPDGVLHHDVTAWAGGDPQIDALAAPPGGNGRARFTATTATSPGELRILLRRAPGLRPDTFELTITLPDGARPRDLPDGASVDGTTIRWKGTPETDLELTIRY